MSLAAWIGVAALGSAATLARFLLDGWVSARSSRALPFGTFAVNTSGAFALGLLSGLALSGDALVLLGTAAVGSYTTFSTWMFETQRLGEDGRGREALANVALSLLAGLAAVALGRAIGRAL